jgi:hypothetical protein
MSEPETLGQLNFIAICQRLLAAVTGAPSDIARESAEADFRHFLAMGGAGRLQEWASSHPELVITVEAQAGRDE